jgi:Fe-S cluster biogenesis protein NfuA/nitrite reductase/ring-hydroxylating ferredoxin subunit
MSEKKEFQKRLERIENLVGMIESAADPNVRAGAIELMQCLMDLNASGIERILEITYENSPNGDAVIDRIASDERAESLLLLYGLHPLDVETRVHRALEKVRPYLQSHKGNVEMLGVGEDGVVHLKLQGSCDGCASSAMTLKLAIEEAIYESAPDIAGLKVEGVVEEKPKSPFVQIESLPKNGAAEEGWREVSGLISLADGSVRAIEVSERPVIFCRIGETFYAYTDICPECGQSMNGSSMKQTALTCPNCHGRFDVMRAGRGLDKPDLYLKPFPLLVEQGRAKIALP